MVLCSFLKGFVVKLLLTCCHCVNNKYLRMESEWIHWEFWKNILGILLEVMKYLWFKYLKNNLISIILVWDFSYMLINFNLSTGEWLTIFFISEDNINGPKQKFSWEMPWNSISYPEYKKTKQKNNNNFSTAPKNYKLP